MTARATVAEWLALHRVDAAALADWIGQAAPPDTAWFRAPGAPAGAGARGPAGGDAAWALCLQALQGRLGPGMGERVALAGARTACLSRPPPGGARAATLPHPETGSPVVLCPYDGTPAMLMALAHECGHAIHLELGPRDPVPPPILRETCACLAEYALVAALRTGPDRALFAACAGLWDDALDHAAGQGGDRLCRALAAPGGPADYRHNYAPARLLAARLTTGEARAARAALFVDTCELSALLGAGATTV